MNPYKTRVFEGYFSRIQKFSGGYSWYVRFFLFGTFYEQDGVRDTIEQCLAIIRAVRATALELEA